MGKKRTRGAQGQGRVLTDEQINEVLANYDMECEKVMARLERSAERHIEAAKAQMDARVHKIPPDVRHISLQEYYDMHAGPTAAERGRHIPPLALASLPDPTLTT